MPLGEMRLGAGEGKGLLFVIVSLIEHLTSHIIVR